MENQPDRGKTARSGMQNISEGNKQTELKWLYQAIGSIEGLPGRAFK